MKLLSREEYTEFKKSTSYKLDKTIFHIEQNQVNHWGGIVLVHDLKPLDSILLYLRDFQTNPKQLENYTEEIVLQYLFWMVELELGTW